MKMWWGPRIGRGDFFFAIVIVNVAYLVGLYLFIGAVSLTVVLGFRSQLSLWPLQPSAAILLAAAVDLLLLSLSFRRLQDAGISGWLALLLPVLPLVLGFVGAAISLFGLICLFLLKPTVGPNRFGPDPRGWTSPEHEKEQKQLLRSRQL